ncbi:MAG: response regulator [Deltaproteobacteria bacterium]|nr:response regulator [Deltaproteobacteria bacterium]
MDNQVESPDSSMPVGDNLELSFADVFDLLAYIGTVINTEINIDDGPEAVFAAVKPCLRRVAPFQTLAFLTVDEENLSFNVCECDPLDEADFIRPEIDHAIAEGTFAWALYQNRPVFLPSQRPEKTVMLHVIATRWRVIGMFFGVLEGENQVIPDTAQKSFTMLLVNIASAMEILDNRQKLTRYSNHLEELTQSLDLKVRDRTQELQDANRSLHQEIDVRAKTEKELRKARDLAETANAAKREFLANMSHEIRTPMNAIIGMNYLATRREQDPQQQEYLEKTKRAANSLLGIINDILDYSKIEAGELKITRTEFSLDSVIDNTRELIGLLAAEKDLELLIDIDRSIPRRLVGDSLRLSQILNNLLNNAVKFTEQGEVVLSARVQKETSEQVRLEFVVRDTGIGIAKNQIEDMFSPFSQADSSTTRKYGGTGLGLAICKRLCDLMSGSVEAISEPGKGSEFKVLLPFGIASKDELDAVSNALSKRESISNDAAVKLEHGQVVRFDGMKALLVEDSKINQEIALALLGNTRIEVTVANNGKEAVEKAQTTDFDLILMDNHMPVMNGVSATREIRKLDNPKMAEMPIIALTASAMSEDREKFIEAGMNDYMEKPIEPEQLYSVLAKWLLPKAAETASLSSTAPSLQPNGELPETPEIDVAIRNGKTTTNRNQKNGHVLVVDDTKENVDILVKMLSDEFDVSVAMDGHEALRAVTRVKPDLVLLDIMMPGMDGYEVCKELKGNAGTESIPVMFLTALSGESDEYRGLKAGAIDYIRKPFNPNLVKARVKTQLALKKHQDHLEELIMDRTAELEKAKKAAEAASIAKSTFLTNMSHELRTPLNGIIAATSLAMLYESDQELEEIHQVIQFSGDALANTIDNVLMFTKLQDGDVIIQKTPFRLDDLLGKLKTAFFHKGQQLELEIDFNLNSAKTPIELVGDQKCLIIVFNQLLENAAKFNKRRPQATIGVAVLEKSTTSIRLEFSVKDNGIGVPSDMYTKIFEPFVQVDASNIRNYDGMGMGLAAGRQLARLMNGDIRIESELDQGSTFFFTAEFGLQETE